MNPMPPSPAGAPASTPKPNQVRQLLLGSVLFAGICGLLVAAVVLTAMLRRAESMRSRASASQAHGSVILEASVARALRVDRPLWRESANGSRELVANDVGIVATLTPIAEGAGGTALALTITSRSDLLESLEQAELAGDALRAAAPDWTGARGFVRSVLTGDRPLDQHLPGYLVMPSVSSEPNGTVHYTFAVGRVSGDGRPDWMAPSTWEAVVWAQFAAGASEWADDACLLASRCVFADPFPWHGATLHFRPSEFGSCESTFGALCRRAVAEAEAIRTPGPLQSSWTRMLEAHRQTIRDLERIHALLDEYDRVELRPDGDGFEDYSTWLSRRDRAAGQAWFDEAMAASETARAGRVEFREWFAERMCFPNLPTRGDPVFMAAGQRVPEWRVPHRPGDPACGGSR